MTDDQKAVVRSCLSQVETGLAELRQLPEFWQLLSEARRQEFKDFFASVHGYQREFERH